jgi:hypothetical protein
MVESFERHVIPTLCMELGKSYDEMSQMISDAQSQAEIDSFTVQWANMSVRKIFDKLPVEECEFILETERAHLESRPRKPTRDPQSMT